MGSKLDADSQFAALLSLLREPAIIFEDTLAGERLLEPVEELSGRIDLIVVLALGEDAHLMQVFCEPRRRLWDVDKAVFDQRGLRMQPHDLLAVGLVARDTVAAIGNQLLDQLGAGGPVLVTGPDSHGSQSTLRWREMDSNLQFRARRKSRYPIGAQLSLSMAPAAGLRESAPRISS